MLRNALVARRLFDRRDGKIQNMRALLIICGGSMRGTYGAGVMVALHQLGLGQVFDTVIGNSTGAPTAGYFLAGMQQTRLGASIYYQDCPRVFLRLSRLHHPLDFNALNEVFRQGPKAMDMNHIAQSPTDFFIFATRTANGQTDLLDVKTSWPNPLAAIQASIAIPTLADPVRVNDEDYVDGDIEPLPADVMIKKFQPTDVVIIPNRHESSLRHWKGRLSDVGFGLTTLRHKTLRMTRGAAQRTKKLAAGIQTFVDAPDVNVGIIWPPVHHRIGLFTRDPAELRAACRDAAISTFDFFGHRDIEPDLI